MLRLEGLEIAQDSFRLSADLSVAAGARVAVIGPSGSGKSTLLETIAGFRAARAGRILWQGRDITPLPPGRRPVTMLFQDGNLFPHLDLASNVGLGIDPDLRLNANDRDRVAFALDRVGLGQMADRRPGTLSGGQQSRAALARVLVMNRPLLLLDEPFSALGPAQRFEMLDLVAALLEDTGATMLMVTHDPGDARRAASHTILVAEGRAHAPAETAALLDNPPPALQAYLGHSR